MNSKTADGIKVGSNSPKSKTYSTSSQKANDSQPLANDFYRQVFDSLEDYAIFTQDLNGIINSWNTAAEHVLGFTEAEMLGKHTNAIFTPSDVTRKTAEKDMADALKYGRVRNERFFLRKDGTTFWGSGLLSQLKNDQGQIIGFTKVLRDLSERKTAETRLRQAEDEVKEGEERFRQLAETIPHIVFSSHADGKPDYYNRRWFEYTGANEAVRIEDWAQFVHPDDVQILIEAFKVADKNKSEFNAEYRLRRYDGEYRWHVTSSLPFHNHHGKVIRWFGTATDIHDRKILADNLEYLSEASRILSSSLDYKETFTNIANLAVPRIADWCVIDMLTPEGTLEAVALSHKDPEKIAWAKELRKLDPPDLSAPHGLARVIHTGEPELYSHISDEMLQQTAKTPEQLELARSIGFTSAMMVPLCQDNTCIGVISFVSTETKRRYNDDDLNMASELANRASLALENAGLYKASQDAITLRDDFISVASHELKTPVTSAKIFTQVLQKHTEQIGDTMGNTYLSKMDRQLDKLTELIYNMLDISKIQVGRMEFHQHELDFDAVVEETVEAMQPACGRHAIKIVGKTDTTVYGDEDRIGQVLSNLIANAVKYSPNAEEIVVHLKTYGNEVICGVQDFGIGIEKEHMAKIFERFYRVFDSTDKTFPGLGIGLYICSEIMQRHHGRLWVESDKGKGSTFYISLPVHQPHT